MESMNENKINVEKIVQAGKAIFTTVLSSISFLFIGVLFVIFTT